ncbi:cytochrome c oxidase subunit 2A [Rummeliibacillus sp. G93]|nr:MULTISPECIES: cytochrome c oxidase subunit 2A [Rummeliibacillus]MBB5168916.1 hypothetical protein [Rummeliibacillus stabekisii]MCM3316811.1 cytochrome c oxidase subunit 2A [Rummeliibacillus stabekisii]UQW96318.1 cytochrome c oxidase subunit 2A [Rummeliibacillus sp. G93]GEL04939.1 hypothetical protein RST01_15660 [Rummeliibacillus stabekisii]
MAPKKHEEEENLKGTLYLVFALGAFIVITWAACFGLFLERF